MSDKHGFDRWAGSYDAHLASRLDAFPFIGYYDVLAAVVRCIGPKPGMRILDVGIGTGLVSEELSKQSCTIFGVDFSDQMHDRGRARLPGADLETADVTAHHLGKSSDEHFDQIVSAYFFHHLDPEQQIIFLTRALVQNVAIDGRIVIADVGFATEKDYRAAHNRYATAWDNDEYYLCGEKIVARLCGENITARYDQISPCAGLLVCAT